MSGIAGLIKVDGAPVALAEVRAIAEASPVRGFDGSRIWQDGPAGLVRHRHATTPEAIGERQPRPSDASGAVMCFDGRLDNREDLLRLLGSNGAGLRDAPDCDLAMALFETAGDSFVDTLVGDYAFAIWQPAKRRLYCARSPGGWRPFLWTFDGKRFAFSSEPRGLIVGLGLERRINEGAIGEYLATRFTTPTDTLWQDIYRLEQGGALALENDRLRTWHWHTERYDDFTDLSDVEHFERFRETFDVALLAVGHSNTPVMAQLSGGLDSSSIVCRATELHRIGRMARQVQPITARYPGQPHDETEWSSLVERHIGIDAEVVSDHAFDPDEARDWSRRTLQPPLRPNTTATIQAIARRTRTLGSRVLLTGDGGDNWWNGSYAHWPDLVRKGRLDLLAREAFDRGPNRSLVTNLRSLASEAFWPIVSSVRQERVVQQDFRPAPHVPAWMNSAWAREIDLQARWAANVDPVALPSLAHRQRYRILSSPLRHLGWEVSHAFAEQEGVELRHPLHDLRLVRLAMAASGGALRRGNVKRHIFREAMRDTLPEAIRLRQTKAFFDAKVVDGILTVLEERRPRDLQVVGRGWIDAAEVEQIEASIRAWRSGAIFALPALPIGPLWMILSIEIWLEAVA